MNAGLGRRRGADGMDLRELLGSPDRPPVVAGDNWGRRSNPLTGPLD